METNKEKCNKQFLMQIAHEIRNPLSSIKIGLQHIVAICRAPNKFKINKLEQALLTQIEVLSNIHQVFADIFKLSRTKKHKYKS